VESCILKILIIIKVEGDLFQIDTIIYLMK